MSRGSQSPFSFSPPPLRPGVKTLLLLLGILSVGVGTVRGWGPAGLADWVMRQATFFPGQLWRGEVWKPFLYSFVVLHWVDLIITALWIWMMGSDLEEQWGRKRLLLFFFGSTALGALATCVLGLVFTPLAAAPIEGGFWTSAMPLLAGTALAVPRREIRTLFVPPFEARLLVPISLGVLLLRTLFEGSLVAVIPSLFTLLAGVLLAGVDLPRPDRLWLRLRVWWIERKLRGRKLRLVKLPGESGPDDRDSLPGPRSGGRGSDEFLH